MFSQLDAGKKIVISSMSNRETEYYHQILSTKYPQKTIYLYNGNSDGNVKEEHFMNVVKYFDMADILIYSPTIVSGLDYNKKRFDKLYGIFQDNSCSQRDFLQMLSRVRHFTDDEIIILEDKYMKNKNNNWNFYHVKDLVHSYQCLRSEFGKKLGFTPNIALDLFTKIIIYNETEKLNKNKSIFLNYFKKLAIEKGHTIRYIEGYEKKEKIATISTIENILNAEDISKKEYRELVLLHGKVTREENFQITKHLYKYRLGVDRLDKSILKMYFKKEQNIKNFISLISPQITYNETKWNQKDIFDTNHIMKRNIIEDTIKTLGFGLNEIKKSIPYEKFKENIEKLVNNSIVFQKFNETRSLFDLRKQKKWDFNDKLRST